MAIPISEFWRENFYKHPPLTQEAILSFTERLKVQLPPLYLELLTIQNGGFTQPLAYPATNTTWSPDHVSLDSLCGIVIDTSIESPLNIFNTEYFIAEDWGLPPHTVAIAGDGHWWIALDYRVNRQKPTITWIDGELAKEAVIASNFSEFYAGLVPAKTFE
jgi:hypothetical protein